MLRGEDGVADAVGERERVRDTGLAQASYRDRTVGDHGASTKLDAHRAGHPLEHPGIGDVADDHLAVLAVDHDDGRRGDPVKVVADHVQLRKRSTHTIGIDGRQAKLRCGNHRGERVAAAHFDRYCRRDLHSKLRLQLLDRDLSLVTAPDLFQADRRRAHPANGHDERVIV